MGGDDEEFEEPPPLNCVSTGDANLVRLTVDDAVMEVLQESGFAEDVKLGNVKMGLMVVACSVACLGQFWDKFDKSWAFPVNRTLLLCCCSVYFICSGILQYILSFVERDAVFYSHPKNGTGSGVVLRTKMPRYSQYYGLLLERRDGSHKLSEDMSVGNFFDEEGNFDEEACKKIIAVFVKKFENTKSE